MACLEPHSLADYQLEKLDEASCHEVEEHLSACALCRERLAALQSEVAPTHVPGRSPRPSAQHTGPAWPAAADLAETIALRAAPPRVLRSIWDREMTVRRSAPPPHAAPDSFAPGSQIGRYVVLRKLGAGGMGEVYAAYDPELDRTVALKLVHPDLAEDSGRTFFNEELFAEAKTLARFSHPNVITVHDAGTFGHQVFMTMELVEGGTLREWLARQPRSWREVREVFLSAGRGLLAAHQAGLVHRDFKPENVLIGTDGRVRVTDFGLARRADSERGGELSGADSGREGAAQPIQFAGTPAYMAPEQLAGKSAGPAADQFSFCVALYEALHGRRPFEVTQTPAGLALDWRPSAPRVRVPARVRRALQRGLSADPDERFEDMGRLLAELDRSSVGRGHFAVAAAAAALLAAALAFAVRGGAAPVCTGAPAALAEVWNPSAAEAGKRAFLATGVVGAAETWERVRSALDRYGEAWTSAHTEACEATRVRGEQSEEALDLRMGCLHRRRSALGSLVELFARADADIVRHAAMAVSALDPLDPCSDLQALAEQVPPPASAELRARVESARAELETARAAARRQVQGRGRRRRARSHRRRGDRVRPAARRGRARPRDAAVQVRGASPKAKRRSSTPCARRARPATPRRSCSRARSSP
ncbi:MAG: protein kinase domain-containing protein [Myxococcales bacterium]|jgi:hypothetical protein